MTGPFEFDIESVRRELDPWMGAADWTLYFLSLGLGFILGFIVCWLTVGRPHL